MEQKMFSLQFTQAGVELMIHALRQLPHIQVDDLVRELVGQYRAQINPPPAPVADLPAEASND